MLQKKLPFIIVIWATCIALAGCSDDSTRPTAQHETLPTAQRATPSGPLSLAVGGTGLDEAHGVATDQDGNVLVMGSFEGVVDFGGTVFDSADGNVFVAKYSPAGNLIWLKQMLGPSPDGPVDVATDPFGNVVATGTFLSTAIFDGVTLTGEGADNVFVVKYDAAGNLLWARQTSGIVLAVAFNVATDPSSNVFIAGFYKAMVTFETTTLQSLGSFDVFVVKYDAAGNLAWARTSSSTTNPEAYGVAVDNSGNAIVMGKFRNTAVFGATTLTSAGPSDIFVTKYNPAGDLVWARAFGGANDGYVRSIAADGSGNVLVVGYFWEGTFDDFVVKFDAAGNVQWAKPVPGLMLRDITATHSGNIFLTGWFTNTVSIGGTSLTSAGATDVFVVEMDAAGNPLSAISAGGPSSDSSGNIVADAWGNAVLTGVFKQTADFGGQMLTSNGGDDIFVFRPDMSHPRKPTAQRDREVDF